MGFVFRCSHEDLSGLGVGPHDGQKRSRDESPVFGNIRYLQPVFIGNKSVSFDIHRSRGGASNGYGCEVLIKKVLTITEMRTYSFHN
jgi:hypothetical protein